jgi:hypothetical protein
MDLLDTGLSWLEDQRKKYMSRTVTYQRGNNTVDVQATIGRTIFRTDDGYGAAVRTESRDFLITAADLVIDGAAVLPERGDQIRETVDAQVFIYEVLAPGDEQHFRYSDQYRRTLRIHTKFSGTE